MAEFGISKPQASIDLKKLQEDFPMLLVYNKKSKAYEAGDKPFNQPKETKRMQQFDSAYQPTDALSFGHAIVALKDGKKVARAGWNGKGMFLYHVPANSYPAQTEAARGTFGDMVPYGAYIAMKTAHNNVVPWLASQTDVLADDWEIVA